MTDYNAPKHFVPVQNFTTIRHLKDMQLSNGLHRSFIVYVGFPLPLTHPVTFLFVRIPSQTQGKLFHMIQHLVL